jgi:putative FmdB family regulatory protein
MALYEYGCPTCDARIEVRRGIGERTPVCCEACGTVMERVFTPPAGPARGRWNPWGTSARSAPARNQ